MSRASFRYEAEAAAAPSVTVITEASQQDDLTDVAESLLAQSLQSWEWIVIAEDELPPPLTDPRVRTVVRPVRAQAIAKAQDALAGFVVYLDADAPLAPTTLEKWAWFLDANSAARSVTGGIESRAGLMARTETVRELGGFDAAYEQLAAVAEPVAYTGGWQGGPDEPGKWPALTDDANAWLPESAPFNNLLAKSRPRLLLIAPWMEMGGADKVTLDMLDQLRAGGWELTVATTLPSEHRLLPVYAERTPDLFPLAHFLPLIDYPRFLRYLIGSRQPDVVLLSNSELGYRVLPYLRHASPETAFVDYCHSETQDWYHGGYPRLSVEYRDMLDLTLTTSSHLRDWMIERGANPARVEVCYANVDADAFRPNREAGHRLRRARGIPDNAKVASFVGRLSSEKQPEVLLAAFAQLVSGGFDAHLIVAGAGPELRRLRRRAARKGLSARVHLLGSVAHEGLQSVYGASDVFCLPSRVEGIALTLYEAMASGVPVVGAEIGGQSELVTADVGVLVSPSDDDQVGAFAAALERLLADDELRDRMGKAGRKRIEESFRIELFGERLVELLDRARELRARDERGQTLDGVVRANATEAIELVRLAQIVHHQWLAQSRPALLRDGYFLAQRVGRPTFLWLTAQGLSWLPRVRDSVRKAALGE